MDEVSSRELTTEVKKDVSMYVQAANALVIASEQDIIVARDNIRAGRELKNKIVEWFKPMKEAARAAHIAICNKETAELEPISEGTQIYNTKITSYQVAEKARLEAEAKKLAEAAEKKRNAAIKKAQAYLEGVAEKALGYNEQVAELQQILSGPDISDDERTILEAMINSLLVLIEQSHSDMIKVQVKVEAVIDEPVPMPVTPTAKVKGVGGLKVELIPEIMNPYVLLAAVANKTIPLAVVSFDMVKIKRLVNEGLQIPGVVTSEKYKTNVR